MLVKTIARLVVGFLIFPSLIQAQVTTSSMGGVVKNANNEPLVGATVSATHNPTGTIYSVASRAGGRYNIYNMNPGGPYTIVVTFVGFTDEKKEDVFLTLGENATQDFALASGSTVLTEVIISTRRLAPGSGKGGAETSIGRDKMTNIPSVGRNLSDYIRYTPQVKITGTGGFSIAGQNNRYNSFMIDGSVNNDVFGVSDQGTNGGRTGAPPISIDAIDQIIVQISPYDASLGNFTGGGINAITRSGTNTLTGSAYYIFRNQDLAGRAPVPQPKPGLPGVVERPKLTDFQNKTYGIRVGGPIVKNKIFYFFNLERQDDNRPQPFDPTTYRGSYVQNDSLNVLINFLNNTHKYDPGDYINNPDLISATRLATKIDWNINRNNQFSASYRFNKAQRTNSSRSSATTINFFNGAEFFPSTTHSGTLELNSRFTNTTNNKIRLTLTHVVDDRGITGSSFPNVQIRDGSNSIFLGSEISSTANLLKQSIFNIYDAFRITSGKHALTMGVDIDYNKTYNLFINRNFGFYEYATISSFLTDARPVQYRRGYSLVDAGKSGDESVNSAARFKTMRIGFFINDDIKLNDNFTLTLGLRADRTGFLDDPATDAFFRDTGAAIISQYYNLEGAQTGTLYDPSFLFSPRIGFNYKLPEENVTLRGGLGLFAGRIPLVWPGGGFQNTGVTIGALQVFNPNITFRPDVTNQYTATDLGLSRIIPQGELNLVARDFKLPQVLRTSLAVDKRLSNGWTFSIEGIFTKNVYEVDWKNLIFLPSATRVTTGPDVRTVFDPLLIALNNTTRNAIKIPLRGYLPLSDIARSPYTSIILVRNTEGRKGYSYNFTFSVDRSFRNGFAFNANYTYGNSVVRNEATSSINSSNWNNIEAVNGRNNLELSISDFDLGHRITSYVSKKFTYANKKLATTITLVYTGQSGNPFSYTMTGNINGDGVSFNDLMYVPTKAEVASMVFLSNTTGGVTYSPTQQRDLFDAYIENDKYLRKRRGKHAERNGARLPFINVIDLSLKQDFNVKIGEKTYQLQLTYEVANFTNMINKEWGRQYFVSFDQLTPLQFASFATGTSTPQFRFSPQSGPGGRPITVSDGISPFNSSRWTSQVGVRLNF